jgi:hypothetical protein
MADLQWDGEASLMRVTPFDHAEPQEELVAHGTARTLVASVLEMSPDAQAGLLLRQALEDDVLEYEAGEIRELAALPGYTGIEGEYDTSLTEDSADVSDVEDEDTLVDGVTSGPDATAARDRDRS